MDNEADQPNAHRTASESKQLSGTADKLVRACLTNGTSTAELHVFLLLRFEHRKTDTWPTCALNLIDLYM